MSDKELIELACAAREKAYAPYSHFCVGAAILTKDGKIYTGCNIENASYSLTVCAERVALFDAVKNGENAFEAIAIVGGKAHEEVSRFCPPCGACRQTLREFFTDDVRFLTWNGQEVRAFSMREMLPESFHLSKECKI